MRAAPTRALARLHRGRGRAHGAIVSRLALTPALRLGGAALLLPQRRAFAMGTERGTYFTYSYVALIAEKKPNAIPTRS